MRFRSALVAATTLLAACGHTPPVDSASRPEPTPAHSAPAVTPAEWSATALRASADHLVDPEAFAGVADDSVGRDGSWFTEEWFLDAERTGTAEWTGTGDSVNEGISPLVPVALWVEGIGVFQAPIVPVGVVDGGEMEIPGGDEVGWYQFGPSPGAEGSAVLAAHVAFDGEDGVFRHLAEVSPGSSVVVGFDDGSIAAFEVVELQQYEKAGLPVERIFSRRGEPTVALITCGGAFDSDSRTFADNVVVYAVPARAQTY